MPDRRHARTPALTAALILLAASGLAGCATQGAPSGPRGSTQTATPITKQTATPITTQTATPVATTRPVEAQRRATDGALDCPASVPSAEGMTVPHPPQGLDGMSRLLPQRGPTSLVVCAYPVMAVTRPQPLVAPFPLIDRTVPEAELRTAIVDLLTWAPRWNGRESVCTAMAADETAYLVGASYADAVVWVAARDDANTCSRSTNGDFVSGAPMGVAVRELLTHQPQPAGPVPAEAACGKPAFGRLGDDRSLAPPGDPVVTVCRPSETGMPRETALDGASSAAVVAALRALVTRPTQHACQGSADAADRRFGLMLTYPTGPSVRTQVDPGCTPAVLGAALESDDVGDVVDLVERSSPPIPAPDPDGSVSSP
ncbi:MAG: hypothetical protein ABI336_07455 [Humibacillus sp.]